MKRKNELKRSDECSSDLLYFIQNIDTFAASFKKVKKSINVICNEIKRISLDIDFHLYRNHYCNVNFYSGMVMGAAALYVDLFCSGDGLDVKIPIYHFVDEIAP